MAWLNEEIAALLREYAELTQITGGDVFRARNYEKAARSVRGWGDDIGPLDAKALRAQIPPGVLELTRVPGLGPKRALQLSRRSSVGYWRVALVLARIQTAPREADRAPYRTRCRFRGRGPHPVRQGRAQRPVRRDQSR
ncbi:MAG: helix-hairpin-helix domain-containing protein [Streptosporangiaceae bacterium]